MAATKKPVLKKTRVPMLEVFTNPQNERTKQYLEGLF